MLHAAGIAFDVLPAHIDETVRDGEAPEVYVRRVAEEKARVVRAQRPGAIVLAADTTVVVDGLILGKPEDRDDARRMLMRLSGRSHQVITAVTLIAPEAAEPSSRVETTVVDFAAITPAELDWYVGTGEPMDKAGAYAIQGGASRFITRIEGSYSNVVGLPVAVVWDLLKQLPSVDASIGNFRPRPRV